MGHTAHNTLQSGAWVIVPTRNLPPKIWHRFGYRIVRLGYERFLCPWYRLILLDFLSFSWIKQEKDGLQTGPLLYSLPYMKKCRCWVVVENANWILG